MREQSDYLRADLERAILAEIHAAQCATAHRLGRRVIPMPLPPPPKTPKYIIIDDEPSRQEQSKPAEPSLSSLLRAVSLRTGIHLRDMVSPRRYVAIVRARQMFCFLADRLTSKSYPQIGRALGGRDHSTIIHAVRKVKAKRELFEPELSEILSAYPSDLQQLQREEEA